MLYRLSVGSAPVAHPGIGAALRRAWMGARDAVRAFVARDRQRRQAAAFRDELRDLDDHTLRDLGFHRSEIESVAAEATGAAETTRARAWLMSQP